MKKSYSLFVLPFVFLACSRAPQSSQPTSNVNLGATQVVKAPSFKPAKEAPFVKVPLGLDDENLNIPADNPLTPEKVELGKKLYFDKRLSVDGTVSCATCHDPKLGWTDQAPVSSGVKGQKGGRSAPTVINSTYMSLQFWDGRAANLEAQALGPLVNPIEMSNKGHEDVVARISSFPEYAPLFQKAFGTGVTKDGISKAIASFERTVLGGNSRYDHYVFGEVTALNESEIRGKDLFFGKGNCARCHAGPIFSDSMFHNLGVGMDKPNADLGRYVVTKEEADKGAFKTPSLRDVTKTAPYMHDGSEATLEAVMDLYDRGGNKNQWLDPRMEPLHLTPQEKADLVAFMKALDSNPYPMVEETK